jgi:hypothetical protein
MHLISTVSLLAVLALAVPAFADEAAPAAPSGQPAASTPAPAPEAPKTRTPNPAGVSDAADKTLWCGQAFVQSSVEVKASGDQAGADAMLKDGNDLVAKGTTMLGQAGFDANKITATKAAYDSEVKTELAGDPDNARYSYEDCLVLTPEGAAPPDGAGAAAPSSN